MKDAARAHSNTQNLPPRGVFNFDFFNNISLDVRKCKQLGRLSHETGLGNRNI